MNRIAENIRNRRIALGMSRYALAKAAGMTNTGLWQLEKGVTGVPHTDSLIKIARVLGCTPQDLLDGYEPANSPRTQA